MNEEPGSIILQTKNFPRGLLIHRYVEFSQSDDWKMMAIISLKMRNPGFEIFIESGFSDGNHCLKLSCSISKDSYAFQLHCLFPVDFVHGHDMSFRMCPFLPIFMLVSLFGAMLLEKPFLGPGT